MIPRGALLGLCILGWSLAVVFARSAVCEPRLIMGTSLRLSVGWGMWQKLCMWRGGRDRWILRAVAGAGASRPRG